MPRLRVRWKPAAACKLEREKLVGHAQEKLSPDGQEAGELDVVSVDGETDECQDLLGTKSFTVWNEFAKGLHQSLPGALRKRSPRTAQGELFEELPSKSSKSAL